MKGHRRRVVQIDALLEGVERHADDALIVVDLLLASTTLVTSVAQGRTTVLAPSAEAARRRARGLPDPLFAAEAGGGGEHFEGTAGPVSLSALASAKRPLIFVCPTAELLEAAAQRSPAVYVACLRNMTATVNAAALRHDRVAVIAAGYGGQERSEDQMMAGLMARLLMDRGYEAGDLRTAREVARWSRADRSVLELGRGADHLRRMGHDDDLNFALTHVDDLDLVCLYDDHEVRARVDSMPLQGVAAAH
jgi:phosphosulfolactate phosphohydrolase-like enzyme